MRMTAELLRAIDESRFHPLIVRIEECLRRDANWNLDAALSINERWPALSSLLSSRR